MVFASTFAVIQLHYDSAYLSTMLLPTIVNSIARKIVKADIQILL